MKNSRLIIGITLLLLIGFINVAAIIVQPTFGLIKQPSSREEAPKVLSNVPATTFFDNFDSLDTSTWTNGTSDAYEPDIETDDSVTYLKTDSDQGGGADDNCTAYMTWNLTSYKMYFRLRINSTSTDMNGSIIGVFTAPEDPTAATACWRLYQPPHDGSEGDVTMDVGNGDTTATVTLTVDKWYDMAVEYTDADDIYWYINGEMQNSQGIMAGDVAPDADTALVLGDFNDTDNCNNIIHFDYVGYTPYDSSAQGSAEFENFVNTLDTTDWRNQTTTPATYTTGEMPTISSGTAVMNSTTTASDLSSLQVWYNRTTSTVIYLRVAVWSDVTYSDENATQDAPIWVLMGTGGRPDGGGKGINTLSNFGNAKENAIASITYYDEDTWRFNVYGTGTNNATTSQTATSVNTWYDDTYHNLVITIVGNQNSTSITFADGEGNAIKAATLSSRYITYDSFMAIGDSDTGAESIDMTAEYLSIGTAPAMNITITDNKNGDASRSETVTYTVTCNYNYDNKAVLAAVFEVEESTAESPEGFPYEITISSGTGTFTYTSPTNGEYTFTVTTLSGTGDSNSYNATTLNSITTDTQKYYTSSGGGGTPSDPGTGETSEEDGTPATPDEGIDFLGVNIDQLTETLVALALNPVIWMIVGASTFVAVLSRRMSGRRR